jgi:polysaccharide pyruvyl transferase WcaK-like protein
MRGNLRYCLGQKTPLGSLLTNSGWTLYKQNMAARRQLSQAECLPSFDDLSAPLTLPQLAGRGREVVVNLWRNRRNRIRPQDIAPRSVQPADKNHPADWRHIIITGWYGTETTGDKAILAEALHFLKRYAPDCRVTLTTINRNISDQMQRELADLRDAAQVEITAAADPALIATADAVMMGGGPLMESQAMKHVWRIFAEANRQRKARIVFGCGVGPLHSEEVRQLTAAVLQMTTAGFFRDQESLQYAHQLAPDNDFAYACDPAVAYMRRWRLRLQAEEIEPGGGLRLASLLRANTGEFVPGKSRSELQAVNRQAAQRLAAILETVCRAAPAQAHLLHMNAPWIGGDDRLFNRLIAAEFTDPDAALLAREYLSLEGLIRSLAAADAAVAMRYHGHIFCMALGIPFLSINYTGKRGKVQSLLERVGYDQWSENWSQIDPDRAAAHLQQLLAERVYWSQYLQEQTDKLVAGLHQTYADVFHIMSSDG